MKKLSNLKGVVKNKNVSIEKRMEAWIEYTSRFYNLDNRGRIKMGCVYHSTVNSPGCAIGQFLPPTVANFIECEIYIEMKRNLDLFENHAPWILDFDVEFLADIQNLHDIRDYWNEYGLSPFGHDHKLFITNKWLKKLIN